MTTDQLLAVLATLLAGVALVAWPFTCAAASSATGTAGRAAGAVHHPSCGHAGDDLARLSEAAGPPRCEVVLLEAVSPDGVAVRAARFVVEARPQGSVVRLAP